MEARHYRRAFPHAPFADTRRHGYYNDNDNNANISTIPIIANTFLKRFDLFALASLYLP